MLFLGAEVAGGGNIHPVSTLEQAAAAAVALARGAKPASIAPARGAGRIRRRGREARARRRSSCADSSPAAPTAPRRSSSGAAAGIATWSNAPLDKRYALPHLAASREHTAIDLGADEFTVGRPHPMIDFAARLERLASKRAIRSVAAIVLDVVLGYGAHADPAGALAPAVREARAAAAKDGRELLVLGFVCGTEDDPQQLSSQAATLAASGMILASGSSAAASLAARAVGGR